MIGEKIRTLRESQDVLLRQLAAQLDMDTAMLSKMERGERSFKKEDILSLAKIFNHSDKELLTLWLTDRLLNLVKDEDLAIEALRKAVKYLEEGMKSK